MRVMDHFTSERHPLPKKTKPKPVEIKKEVKIDKKQDRK